MKGRIFGKNRSFGCRRSVLSWFHWWVSKYVYPAADHVITGNLRIIFDSRIRSIIAKGPKYRFPVHKTCREKIAESLNEYCNRWCKREHVEGDTLKDWKVNIFKIIDRPVSFYSHNTNM